MNDYSLLRQFLNECDEHDFQYKLINEEDQFRIELHRDEKYVDINATFDDEKCAIFYENDTYYITDLKEVINEYLNNN